MYRKLKPAPERPREKSPSPNIEALAKRSPVRVACDGCHMRKTACDANQPQCFQCVKRKVECVYRDQAVGETPSRALKRTNQQLRNDNRLFVEIMQQLKRVPPDRMLETLESFDSLTDPASMLALLKQAQPHPLPELSEQSAACAALPHLHSRAELELMACHPVVYPNIAPTSAKVGGVEAAPQLDGRSGVRRPTPFGHPVSALHGGKRRKTNPLVQVGPSPPPAYCDSRLNQIDIGYWTLVPVTNEFAAAVISLYLCTDHAIFGCFDADLFLNDLASKSLGYCSPLLVSAVMCWGCHNYSVFDVTATSLVGAFYEEAYRLWTATKSADSVLSIAAALLLSVACVSQGEDAQATAFVGQLLGMGRRLRLFNVDHTPQLMEDLHAMPENDLRASSWCAWGVFTIITIESFYLREKGIEIPPALPVFGGNPIDVNSHWKGKVESWVVPSWLGHTHVLLSKFCLVLREMNSFYWGHVSPVVERATPAFAQYIYMKILACAESLEVRQAELPPKPYHHFLYFRMLSHCVIIDLFRPFVDSDRQKDPKPPAETLSLHEAAFQLSARQLRSIAEIYRSRHVEARYSLWWNTALLYLANLSLSEENEQDRKANFLSCIEGYQSLFYSYRIAEAITRGLLAMAIAKGLISVEESCGILEEFMRHGKHHKVSDIVRGSFVVDLHLAMSDTTAARVINMVERFEEMTVLNVFTNDADLLSPIE